MVRVQGKRSRGPTLEIRTVASLSAPPRVGIVVPLHGHTAVERNRVKRRLREIVRTQRMVSASLGTMVVLALPAAYGASFGALRTELCELYQRATR